MNLFEKYRTMNIDGSLLSLEYAEITDSYFCYPVNAEVIGFEGSILYCFLPEYGEMVFASNPESCADKNVYPLAENFHDFLRLVVACGSANPVEQAVWMSKEQFAQHLQDERAIRTAKQSALIDRLCAELELSPMSDPYEYIKALQADFDDSKIQYPDEYYDVLGIEAPGCNCDTTSSPCFEFETVTFEVEK